MILPLLVALLAGATPLERIAVMDVTPRGDVSPRVAQVVSDDVLSEVRRRNPNVSVIGSEEVRALLGAQAEKQRLGCQQGANDLACMAEIGGALGAEKLVLGSVGQLGDTYLLTVKLVDVRRAKVLSEASARVETHHQGELIGVASRLVGHLFNQGTLTGPLPSAEVERPVATESHPRPLAIVLGSVAVVAAVVAIVGVVQVAKFNSGVASNVNAGTPGVDYAAYQSAHTSASTWQALSIGFGAGAVLCAGGTALAW
jgi:hypothetical protein